MNVFISVSNVDEKFTSFYNVQFPNRNAHISTCLIKKTGKQKNFLSRGKVSGFDAKFYALMLKIVLPLVKCRPLG